MSMKRCFVSDCVLLLFFLWRLNCVSVCASVYIYIIYRCICMSAYFKCERKGQLDLWWALEVMPLCGLKKKSNWRRENIMFCIDGYAYIKCLGFKVFWNAQWFYMYMIFSIDRFFKKAIFIMFLRQKSLNSSSLQQVLSNLKRRRVGMLGCRCLLVSVVPFLHLCPGTSRKSWYGQRGCHFPVPPLELSPFEQNVVFPFLGLPKKWVL